MRIQFYFAVSGDFVTVNHNFSHRLLKCELTVTFFVKRDLDLLFTTFSRKAMRL